MSNITSIIKTIRDIMRKDTGVDGDAQRISQMVWMLFMKIFSDKEEEWQITIKKYKSPIPENLKWNSWAANAEGLTGNDLIDFINIQAQFHKSILKLQLNFFLFGSSFDN